MGRLPLWGPSFVFTVSPDKFAIRILLGEPARKARAGLYSREALTEQGSAHAGNDPFREISKALRKGRGELSDGQKVPVKHGGA